MKILIVEDDTKLRNELKKFLENNGYEVDVIINFNDTLTEINNKNFDLILLDLNLPNINGEYLVKELRKTTNIPIIVVTSKNTEIDELMSINYGADDFITKPYNTTILLARIERLLKRSYSTDETIKYQDLLIDVKKASIIKEDKILELSRNEFRIIYYLIINRGKVVSRDELMNYLWDNDDFVDDNTLTVNINRLRTKLENWGYPNIIITKRGLGYIVI